MGRQILIVRYTHTHGRRGTQPGTRLQFKYTHTLHTHTHTN